MQNRADVGVASSLHGVIFSILYICGVKAFEPLQKVKVALKVPFYEILDWNGLNAGMGGDVNRAPDIERWIISEMSTYLRDAVDPEGITKEAEVVSVVVLTLCVKLHL